MRPLLCDPCSQRFDLPPVLSLILPDRPNQMDYANVIALAVRYHGNYKVLRQVFQRGDAAIIRYR